MIKMRELSDNMVVIHDKTQGEYVVITSNAQLKVDDGKWLPAVTYRENKAATHHTGYQIYVRDTATFMANFSLPVKE